MDVWDTLIKQARETEKYAKIARENIEATAKYWREKRAEIPVQKIKEGKIECERGGMYHERPHVQLQPGDYGLVSFEQPETRKGDKH